MKFLLKFIFTFCFLLLPSYFINTTEAAFSAQIEDHGPKKSNVSLSSFDTFQNTNKDADCNAKVDGVEFTSKSSCLGKSLVDTSKTGLHDYTGNLEGAKTGNDMFRVVFQKLADYTKKLLIPITILLMTWAGIYLLVNRNDENELEEKKNFVFGIFAGFAIILIAPRLVDHVFFGQSGELLSNSDSATFANQGVQEIMGIIQFIKSFVVVTAIAFMILSAYQLIFAGESEDEVGKAKTRIIFSVIGIAIIITAEEIIGSFFVLDRHGNISAPDTNRILILISYWANQILGFLGVIGVLAIVWAGFQMIIHFGDEDKVEKSKTIIKFVIIGLFVAALSWTIIRFFTTPNAF